MKRQFDPLMPLSLLTLWISASYFAYAIVEILRQLLFSELASSLLWKYGNNIIPFAGGLGVVIYLLRSEHSPLLFRLHKM